MGGTPPCWLWTFTGCGQARVVFATDTSVQRFSPLLCGCLSVGQWRAFGWWLSPSGGKAVDLVARCGAELNKCLAMLWRTSCPWPVSIASFSNSRMTVGSYGLTVWRTWVVIRNLHYNALSAPWVKETGHSNLADKCQMLTDFYRQSACLCMHSAILFY